MFTFIFNPETRSTTYTYSWAKEKAEQMMEYKILTAHNAGELEALVNESIMAGFTPLGGVSRSMVDEYSDYTQAMIRTELRSDHFPLAIGMYTNSQ